MTVVGLEIALFLDRYFFKPGFIQTFCNPGIQAALKIDGSAVAILYTYKISSKK